MSGVDTAAPVARAAPAAYSTAGATMRAIYIIWYRDVLRYWRERTRLFASLAQPLLFLIVFGTGLGSTLRGGFGGGSGGGGIEYITFIYPGIISMAVLFTAIFGAMSIVWDREFGFLKEVLVAPINRSAVAIGKTLGSTTQAMVQGLILLVVAPLVGAKLTVVTVLELIPLTFVLAFGLSALGVMVASRMRSMQGFQVVMNFLLMPMFFLGGALFPVNGLPGWLTVLTRIDPVAYGVDPIRRVVLSGAGVPQPVVDRLSLSLGGQPMPIPSEVGILLLFGAVLLLIAIRNFQVRD